MKKSRPLWDLVKFDGGHLHALVFQKPAGELGLGIRHLLARVDLRHRQQQLALDLHEVCSHHEIVGRKLKVALANELDVAHVLLGHKRHRNLHHVELLPADEIKKQIERPFKAFQKDLQRIGRNVEPVGDLKKRLAVKARKRHAVDGIGRCGVRHPGDVFERRLMRLGGLMSSIVPDLMNGLTSNRMGAALRSLRTRRFETRHRICFLILLH